MSESKTAAKKKQQKTSKTQKPGIKKGRRKINAVETTIHIRRKVRNITNHKRTPRAVKVIRFRARRLFNIPMVKLDTSLNKALWVRGIKRPPHRVRVRFQLKRLKGKGGQPCVVCSHVPITSFKNLQTKKTFSNNGIQL